MGIVVAWWLATSLAGLFICWPINSGWNPEVPGHCGNQVMLLLATPIPWIITDFAVLIAPIPLLGTLHLPTAQKLGVMCIFSIGGL